LAFIFCIFPNDFFLVLELLNVLLDGLFPPFLENGERLFLDFLSLIETHVLLVLVENASRFSVSEFSVHAVGFELVFIADHYASFVREKLELLEEETEFAVSVVFLG